MPGGFAFSLKEGKMFQVFVFLTFATGAAGGHRFFTGRGQAIARSPKVAYQQAYRQALLEVGEGSRWMSIFHDIVVVNLVTNKMIQDIYSFV
jgi:hypothetical protein